MAVRKLLTLGPDSRKREFTYSGSIDTEVNLYQTGSPTVSANLFAEAMRHFAGRRVYGGFSQDNPTPGGFGEWVARESPHLNSRKLSPRYGSFIAAILCAEADVRCELDGNAVVLYFPEARRTARA
jgi:hypothetical protein